MEFNIQAGIVAAARWVPTPNYSQRPDVQDVSLLVIHNISLPPGEFGGGFVEAFFQNQLDSSLHPYFAEIEQLCVSAHCFIDRAGVLTQFVNLHDRAWHAGISEFAGRDNCNDYSVGIELEGTDYIPYSHQQYLTLASLCANLLRYFPAITPERIVGHCTVAPERKSDPGPSFEWDYFHQLLAARQQSGS